jgi:hypothetical protein
MSPLRKPTIQVQAVGTSSPRSFVGFHDSCSKRTTAYPRRTHRRRII